MRLGTIVPHGAERFMIIRSMIVQCPQGWGPAARVCYHQIGILPLQRRSPLIPIFLIVVVDVLGLAIILPLLPFYAEKLGASPTTVGLLVSTYAACQLIAGPLLGRMSDQVG